MITDAIRDEKVLKFKVDYNDVRPQFHQIETEQDEKNLAQRKINRHYYTRTYSGNHPLHTDPLSPKTHRMKAGGRGFNAMFAVSSVDAAKAYYEAFKQLQQDAERPLRVATIFSFAANEEQDSIGEIPDKALKCLL